MSVAVIFTLASTVVVIGVLIHSLVTTHSISWQLATVCIVQALATLLCLPGTRTTQLYCIAVSAVCLLVCVAGLFLGWW